MESKQDSSVELSLIPKVPEQDGRSLGQMTFFKAGTKKIISNFQPMDVSSSYQTISVAFSIVHKVLQVNYLDILDGLPLEQQGQNEKLLKAYLKFKLVKSGDCLFLTFECHSYPEVQNYDLNNLLATLCGQNSFRTVETNKFCRMAHSNLKTRTVSIEDEETAELVSKIDRYNADCLSRLAELTQGRDNKAFNECSQLKKMLLEIRNDYKSVTDEEYQFVLNGLKSIEANEYFRNDPPIHYVYQSIDETLSVLRQKALLDCPYGIQINAEQLDLFLDELKKHESVAYGNNVWMQSGSIDVLKAKIAFFLNKDLENAETISIAP